MLPSARIFHSRWSALLWAGGILWTAADIAQSAPHEGVRHATRDQEAADPAEADLNAADLAALSNALDL